MKENLSIHVKNVERKFLQEFNAGHVGSNSAEIVGLYVTNVILRYAMIIHISV